MNLQTYDDLKQAVARWINRKDAEFLADVPEFIRLAEAKINRLLENHVNLLCLAIMTFNDAERELPCEFRGVVNVFIDPPNGGTLHYMTPQDFTALPHEVGIPRAYTVVNRHIHVWPVPSKQKVKMWYKKRLDLLNYGPNWVLETHPDVYLFGALVEASAFMVEDERVPLWAAKFDQAIAEINKEARRMAGGGRMQTSPNTRL